MTFLTLCFILLSVLLSVIAQILLKQGMSSSSVQDALTSQDLSAVMVICSNIFVIAGLFAYISSAGIWLLVLSKIEVSKAYPFVGLGFIFTMLFAYWFLNEPLTVSKICGTLVILVGVVLISR